MPHAGFEPINPASEQLQTHTLERAATGIHPSTKYLFIIKPTRCTNFTNLFWQETVHVSESSSVHHREFIHCTFSNGMCHTGL